MPHRQVVLQLESDACLHPPGIVSRHAQLNGEPVYSPKGGIQALLYQ